MEIVEDRDDYCEEEEDQDEEKAQMLMSGCTHEMGRHSIQTFPFYPSSSSPSPPSSSSSAQYHKLGAAAAPQGNGRWGGGGSSTTTTTKQSNYDNYKQQYQLFSSWNNSGGFEYSRGADHQEGAKSTSTSTSAAAAAAAMGFANNYNYSSAQFDAMETSTGGDPQAAAGRDVVHHDQLEYNQGGGGGGGGQLQQQQQHEQQQPHHHVVVEREHMFDKVVTPSDVGKLNRLVIPKQHAEKYFPLDSSANEKGLLLSFEDRSGKPWRFRYSYWNSSQSYVMTKGWSRFVKEKKLDAGDIVSFERGVGEMGKDRLYIDWKRRPDTAGGVLGAGSTVVVDSSSSFRGLPLPAHHPISSFHRSLPWGRIFFPPPQPPPPPPHSHLPIMPPPPPTATATATHMHHHHHLNYASAGYNVVNPGGSVFYLRSAGPPAVLQHEHRGGGGGSFGLGEIQEDAAGLVAAAPMVFESVPVVHGGKAVEAHAKRFRLFGVNLECPTGELEGDNDVLSSSAEVDADAHASHTEASFFPHHHHHHQHHVPPDHDHDDEPPHPHQLQLRLCGGGPLPNTSAQDHHLPRKTRPSLSFDFDI